MDQRSYGPLSELLCQALPSGPDDIDSALPIIRRQSAVIALSLHCLMVKAGFRSIGEDQSASPLRFLRAVTNSVRRRNPYVPPKDWLELARSTPEWYLRYLYSGKLGVFVLRISVQESTQRMFVQVSEEGNTSNVQMMGLVVDKYVPEERVKGESSTGWRGIIRDEERIRDHFQQYISEPLIEKANDSDAWGSEAWVVKASVLVAAAAAASMAVLAAKNR